MLGIPCLLGGIPELVGKRQHPILYAEGVSRRAVENALAKQWRRSHGLARPVPKSSFEISVARAATPSGTRMARPVKSTGTQMARLRGFEPPTSGSGDH